LIEATSKTKVELMGNKIFLVRENRGSILRFDGRDGGFRDAFGELNVASFADKKLLRREERITAARARDHFYTDLTTEYCYSVLNNDCIRLIYHIL
jgi:hypothetical protein